MKDRHWVTAAGAILAVIVSVLGLAFKFIESQYCYMLMGMAWLAFGLGRKLDRLNGVKVFLFVAFLSLFAGQALGDYRATKDRQTTQELLNRVYQAEVTTIYEDTLTGSADTTDVFRIDKLSGNTGFVTMMIYLDTIGTPTTGFSYQWEMYLDDSDTLTDGSINWSQNRDGTSVEIATGSAILTPDSWFDILDIPVTGYIRYRLFGGTDSDNSIRVKMVQWVW